MDLHSKWWELRVLALRVLMLPHMRVCGVCVDRQGTTIEASVSTGVSHPSWGYDRTPG